MERLTTTRGEKLQSLRQEQRWRGPHSTVPTRRRGVPRICLELPEAGRSRRGSVTARAFRGKTRGCCPSSCLLCSGRVALARPRWGRL